MELQLQLFADTELTTIDGVTPDEHKVVRVGPSSYKKRTTKRRKWPSTNFIQYPHAFDSSNDFRIDDETRQFLLSAIAKVREELKLCS